MAVVWSSSGEGGKEADHEIVFREVTYHVDVYGGTAKGLTLCLFHSWRPGLLVSCETKEQTPGIEDSIQYGWTPTREYIDAFLATYPAFTTTSQVLQCLETTCVTKLYTSD